MTSPFDSGEPEAVDRARRTILDTVPWVKASGLRIERFEKGRVTLALPREGHVNHVGVMFGGSQYMLMELAFAALFLSLFGVDEFVPVSRELRVRFENPCLTEARCDLELGEEEARALLSRFRDRGAGDFPILLEVMDAAGRVVSRADSVFFVFPS